MTKLSLILEADRNQFMHIRLQP